MPVKYFCDECGVEISEPWGLYTTGKMFCPEHLEKWSKEETERNLQNISESKSSNQ